MASEIKSRLHRTFVENVRARRHFLGLTQTEVATRMKVTYGSYAQIEHGRHSPSLDVIERVSKALKISASELLSAQEVTASV